MGVLGPIVEAHAEFVVELDAEGRLVRWTEGLGRATGRSDTDLDGTPLWALASDDTKTVERAVETALSGQAEAIEATMGAETGPRHYLRLAPSEDGGDTAVVGVCRELGSSPTAGERQALERTTDAVLSLDEEWTITYVNEQARSILAGAMGAEPDEQIVGRHLWDSIPDAVGTLFYDRYHEAMETQETVAFEAEYDPLDTVFEVRAYPSESGLSVYFRDVTERRQRRRALTERERTLREMYEITSDTDRDFEGQVGALLELGQEVLNADYGVLSEIVGDEYVHRVARSPGGVIEPGMRVPLSATVCERTASEQQRVVLANIAEDDPEVSQKIAESDFEWDWAVNCYVGAPVTDGDEVYGTFCFYDGEPRGEGFSEWETTVVDTMAQWVSYELTKRQATERLRRQNERLEEFVSVVSHDLRNPLETLSGHLELARETGGEEHFDWCRTAIERMDTLIDDLLELARVGADVGETEPVDLAEIATACWDVVESTDATVVVETERTVDADPSRLRQLFENLFRNAVQHGSTDSQAEASGVGAGVTVTVGDTEEGFYVADDGLGIPEEDRDRVFEAGVSSAEEGTGFGLKIVEQVTEAHGWSVRLVESEDGGARFEFIL